MKKNKKIHSKYVSDRLMQYAKKEKIDLAKGIFYTLGRTSMEIIGPVIIGYILNHYIRINLSKHNFLSITKWLLIYFIVYIACGIFSNLAKISFEKAANKITFTVQKDVFNHVQNLPISYFDQLPAGNIVSRITNDTKKLKTMFQLVLADMATAAIIVVGLVIMLFITNFFVGLIMLLTMPIIYIIFKDLRKKSSRYSYKLRNNISTINSSINEDIQNMELIQVYNKENEIKEEFNSINKKIFNLELNFTKLYSYSAYGAIDTMQYITTLLVLLYFGLGHLSGFYAVTIGSLYISIDYASKIYNNLNTIIVRYGEMEQSYSSAAHIFDLFNMKTMEESPKEIHIDKGDVVFRNVSFAYGKEPVLKDISFEVKGGHSVAFVGPTGSGKSTIINLLLNFYKAQDGNVEIDGKDIYQYNRNSLRQKMAVVLQDAFLFESTIEDNIRLSDENIQRKDIIQALNAVGGERIVARGIDEKIIEKGANLSQGEKQLISFARAYIRNPKILILDEATSNIDTDTEKMIQQGIEQLKKDRTTIIIAHRLSTIKNVDCIFVLNKGKIIEQGTHEELINQNGYYTNMYKEQIKEY